MIQFLTMVSAVFVGLLLIGVLLAFIPKRKPALSCAFCGQEAHSLYDVVEHVKQCEKHPLKREIDAWWAIAKAVLENPDNTLCDESRKLLEGIVKEGEQ